MNQIPISKLMMPWHSFEYIMVGTTKEGKPECVLKLEYKATNSTTSLDFLKPKLKQLIFHQLVPSDRNNTENVELANDFFIPCIDLYTIWHKTKFKAPHRYNFQIIILVHVTWIFNLDHMSSDPKRTVVDGYGVGKHVGSHITSPLWSQHGKK